MTTSKITFIIPSIGRETLKDTIESLEKQTNSDWNAIIAFDGCSPNFQTEDPRIRIIQIEEKLGQEQLSAAGLVRNTAIHQVKTEWIAFVDDDDTLAHNYVETFYQESATEPTIDVIIFRMTHYGGVVPFIFTDTFYTGSVGISFAMRLHIFQSGIEFIPGGTEDYCILNRIREKNYKMMISPFVRYFIRKQISEDEKDYSVHNHLVGNRVFIN